MRQRKNLNKTIFLGALLSIFLFCSSYVQYDTLAELDLLSSNPKFENLDLGNLLLDKQPKLIHSGFPSKFLFGKIFCIPTLLLSVESLPSKESLVLRC